MYPQRAEERPPACDSPDSPDDAPLPAPRETEGAGGRRPRVQQVRPAARIPEAGQGSHRQEEDR